MSIHSSVAIFVPTTGIKYLTEEEAQELFGSMETRLRKMTINMSAMAVVSLQAAAELRVLSPSPTSPGSAQEMMAALKEGICQAGEDVEREVAAAAIKFRAMTAKRKAALISLWMS